MKTHKDLDIWKKGIELVVNIYKITKDFPANEKYGLCSQMQGAARNSKADYIRFVYIALGSLSELETQMIIAEKLGYVIETEKMLDEIEVLRRMTLNFLKSLKANMT